MEMSSSSVVFDVVRARWTRASPDKSPRSPLKLGKTMRLARRLFVDDGSSSCTAFSAAPKM